MPSTGPQQYELIFTLMMVLEKPVLTLWNGNLFSYYSIFFTNINAGVAYTTVHADAYEHASSSEINYGNKPKWSFGKENFVFYRVAHTFICVI
jgi:hypothetical protein